MNTKFLKPICDDCIHKDDEKYCKYCDDFNLLEKVIINV